MRVAIVGSGISGLVAAYHLQGQHELTVFEANDYVGGHTHTVDVEVDGTPYAIDTGFIVFNDWTYPRFRELLSELRVTSRPTTMSFSVRDEATGLEYNGHSLNTLFAQRRNLFRPSFYRMLADIVRFGREALQRFDSCDDQLTVDEFLARDGYSREFAEQYLIPMGAAIWSCPPGKFGQFPIRFIIEFYHNHGLLNLVRRPTWHVIEGGSRSYVRRMTRGFADRIRLNTPVQQVRRGEDCVWVTPRHGLPERFDHVIFACHSDQALRMLGGDATPVERELLDAFPYEPNVAVLHTDTRLLPRSRRAWASWNYCIQAGDAASATVTYNMNILQGLVAPKTFCVTLNDTSRIAPHKILGSFEYAHPIFTTRRAAAQARHGEVLNANRTSYCGAYWGNGFHEDGVVSALAVVRALGVAAVAERPTSLAPQSSLAEALAQ